MKLLISIIIIIPIIISALNFCHPTSIVYQNIPTKDSIPDRLFYGLTAYEITNLPLEKIKELCAAKEVTLSQFVLVRAKAKNYLLKQKINRDSIEVVKIYERIDKHLDIDK